jgi:hypothetical protein
MTHKELIEQGKKWILKEHTFLINNYKHRIKCQFGFSELVTYSYETPDIIGFSNNLSMLIECKVSRVDFKRDSKKIFRNHVMGMGNLRLYLSPQGMLEKHEIPDKWGLLEISGSSKIEIAKQPQFIDSHEVSTVESSLFYSIVRRVKNKEDISKYLF